MAGMNRKNEAAEPEARWAYPMALRVDECAESGSRSITAISVRAGETNDSITRLRYSIGHQF